jgi:hypothetical protein
MAIKAMSVRGFQPLTSSGWKPKARTDWKSVAGSKIPQCAIGC